MAALHVEATHLVIPGQAPTPQVFFLLRLLITLLLPTLGRPICSTQLTIIYSNSTFSAQPNLPTTPTVMDVFTSIFRQ